MCCSECVTARRLEMSAVFSDAQNANVPKTENVYSKLMDHNNISDPNSISIPGRITNMKWSLITKSWSGTRYCQIECEPAILLLLSLFFLFDWLTMAAAQCRERLLCINTQSIRVEQNAGSTNWIILFLIHLTQRMWSVTLCENQWWICTSKTNN